MSQELPGLDRIRARFLHLQTARQADIAQYALLAWESDDADTKRLNLQAAQNTLHQIAGTAGSLGFREFGQTARKCEELIIKFFESAPSRHSVLMQEILTNLDAFVTESQNLISRSS
ncbi:Hpt domain-containing protein [Sulfitobacter sp. F26169L]|uniref:Hpt domain-containing protein n=1 Tax=Sulfitobacter sp. F26169L TaxID=2996015 RepID=UPI0022608377|nr:Hpt domain-containing protein [Sulfitobacter sp. F26169L]MCX7566486.1 Hpt domain-containing protein [Sulfitobacter sp. F26169L]